MARGQKHLDQFNGDPSHQPRNLNIRVPVGMHEESVLAASHI